MASKWPKSSLIVSEINMNYRNIKFRLFFINSTNTESNKSLKSLIKLWMTQLILIRALVSNIVRYRAVQTNKWPEIYRTFVLRSKEIWETECHWLPLTASDCSAQYKIELTVGLSMVLPLVVVVQLNALEQQFNLFVVFGEEMIGTVSVRRVLRRIVRTVEPSAALVVGGQSDELVVTPRATH